MPRARQKGSQKPSGDHSPGPRRRWSKEVTTERLLDAAEELFSARDPKSVTVRQISERAGVTHSLAHQYIGSKADIYNAVIQRTASDRQRIIAENPNLKDVMPLLLADVLDRKLQTLSVVRSAMDGMEYTSLQERIATGSMLIRLAEEAAASGESRVAPPSVTDSRMAMAACICLVYGWVALEPWLLQALDLSTEDSAELHQQVVRIGTYLSELALPPAESAPGEECSGD